MNNKLRGYTMALPCFCYHCAICLSQESLTDEECLAIEQQEICKNNDCDNCGYKCSRFTTAPVAKEGKLGDFITV